MNQININNLNIFHGIVFLSVACAIPIYSQFQFAPLSAGSGMLNCPAIDSNLLRAIPLQL